MKNILILTTVSGFLKKFEMENVKILQSMGYTVHYAANMNEQHYPFDERELEREGIRLHHIDIARSPYMLNYNVKAFGQLITVIKKNHICAIHCHTPVGGMLGRQMDGGFAGGSFRSSIQLMVFTSIKERLLSTIQFIILWRDFSHILPIFLL
uniref:glycosyltransferase n=1 Tax=Mediterraneibacter glycyrrhizinilyticus TaxID=342942 RepID=UPI0006CFBA81